MTQLVHDAGRNDDVRDSHGPDLDGIRGATEDVRGRTTVSYGHESSSALGRCASDDAESERF